MRLLDVVTREGAGMATVMVGAVKSRRGAAISVVTVLEPIVPWRPSEKPVPKLTKYSSAAVWPFLTIEAKVRPLRAEISIPTFALGSTPRFESVVNTPPFGDGLPPTPPCSTKALVVESMDSSEKVTII